MRWFRSAKILQIVLAVAAPVFLVILIATLALVCDWILAGQWPEYRVAEPPTPRRGDGSAPMVPTDADWWRALDTNHLELVWRTSLGWSLVWSSGLALFGLIIGRLIGINKFSLHSLYRQRLIRAYLGASRGDRRPDDFTGLDQNDDLPMTWLWITEESSAAPVQRAPTGHPGRKLFHVVNMTLNLIGGDNLAWQQRKAGSFTVSPLHAGSSSMMTTRESDSSEEKAAERRSSRGCYRPTPVYGGPKGVSLGTAVAISGAAASPNMGYQSSPVATLLMTLFNVRLGWWLGNPGSAGARTFSRGEPALGGSLLVREALGLTDDRSDFVYLSDGGHFDNLGLYEMVLRRCHFIVFTDAGFDPKCSFEDVGNAMRKIRIDLGVPITFSDVKIESRTASAKFQSKHCAVGTIDYKSVDGPGAHNGVLLWIKPALCGEEPVDVLHYAHANEAFPHDPTLGDQFFDEWQLESYRMLGLHAVEKICRVEQKADWESRRSEGLPLLVTRAREYLGSTQVTTKLAESEQALVPPKSRWRFFGRSAK